MKLTKLCLIFLASLLLNVGTETHAEGFVPKEIKLITPSLSYSAGMIQEIGIILSNKQLKKDSVLEYGVAREIKNGFITSFEILSTETQVAGDQFRLSVKIPNITKELASSSYVIYLKSYVKHDPESENFFVTNPFSITPNETPLVYVKNINLLQGNGQRAGLTEGPSIYDPTQIATTTQATSTSIEITFESNVETILKPAITFEKLRSTDDTSEYIPNDIQIKKGLNYIVIPLPTFSYQPGVYVGRVNFRNDQLKNDIIFQYIVAGESATVGQVTYNPLGEFTFAVFGTPIDMRGVTPVISSEIHTVQTTFMFKGKQVYATSTVANFASSSLTVTLPSQIKKVDMINVEIISNTTGKVLYQGEKTTNFYIETPQNKLYVFYILFMLLLIMFALLRHKMKFAIVLVLFVSFIIGQQVFGEAWDPNYSPYRTAYVNNLYVTEGYSNFVALYFSENISQKTFTCGEDLKIMFKAWYIQCSNTYAGLKVGFSTSSPEAAGNSQIEITNNSDASTLESQTYAANNGEHYFYNNITNFMQYNGGPLKGAQTLYAKISSTAPDTIYFDPGWTTYTIPLTVSACTACSNAPSTSNVPNFKIHGRNYYYSSADSMLYYRSDTTPIDAPAETCAIDTCADTPEVESRFPTGTSWRPMPGTYSTDPNRYACLPVNITCSCNNSRNRICTNSNTSTTSTDINHPSCLLQAYCKTSYQDRGRGTVTFDAYNKIGTLNFIPAGNPIKGLVIPPEGLTVVKKVVDSFDGRTSTASCELKYDESVVKNTGKPSVLSFYSNPKIVNEGSKCRFGWETNNMTSCTISGLTVPVNVSAGDLFAFQTTSGVNDQNVIKTLICTGKVGDGPTITESKSTTCFVTPRLREN